MDTGLDLFLRGLLIGLAVAMPVGPISLLCVHRTLAGGWLTGYASGMGAASADAIYATAAGLGLWFTPSLILSYSNPTARWKPVLMSVRPMHFYLKTIWS